MDVMNSFYIKLNLIMICIISNILLKFDYI